MLVICLGVQASGSTWLFNAARMLLAHGPGPAVSLVEDDGLSVIDNIPLGVDQVLVKAHAFDLRGVTVASLSRARLIVSTRDVRDCLVSQQERFDEELRNALRGISRSLASIAMLPRTVRRLDFRYEDRFFERPSTIDTLARFLETPVDSEAAADIFRALRPQGVRRTIARWVRSLGDQPASLDPVTQWHPRHLGDGRSGKWRERLPPEHQGLVMDCLGPLSAPGAWRSAALRWPGELFFHADGRSPGGAEEIECDGTDRILVYGPYHHLPVGRWWVSPQVEPVPGRSPAKVKLDLHLPNTGRGVAAEQVHSPGGGPPAPMELDVRDHFQPLELRLSAVAGERGWVRFRGAELRWIGPPTIPERLAAYAVASGR